jgi:ABC-type oligopeptide transport system substrate-binding subunit
VQVNAPDDTTLEIGLQFPAGYFFTMSPMWMLRAAPREAVEEHGDTWTEPGNILTNGPYFVKENTRGVQRTFVRNTALPADLGNGGNVEVVTTLLIEDEGTAFSLYRDAQMDTTSIPEAEFQSVLDNPEYANQIIQRFDLGTFYFAFAQDKAPFDDAHARRAFGAILDRQKFVEQVVSGQGQPMIHFTAAGIFGAPPVNEVGVGFDPEFAKAEIEAAGYPNCEGFPQITVTTTARRAPAAEFVVAAAEEHLGCAPDVFQLEQVEFSVLLEITSRNAAPADRPNLWFISWFADYSDANNFVGDVLSCKVANDFMRACTEVDDLIDAAAAESDQDVRRAMYAEIEEGFFGPNGEHPIIPLYSPSGYSLVQTWYTGPFAIDGLLGGIHWDARNIDMAAKLAAQG